MDGILLERQEGSSKHLRRHPLYLVLRLSFKLFARRGNLPDSNGPPSEWTSFEMSLREPSPIPVAFDFTRFLASSITFMSYLSEVSVYFDDKRLVRLSKTSGLPKQLGMPQGIQTWSKMKIMNVTTLRSTRASLINL